MSPIARQLAQAIPPVLLDYRRLLARVQESAPASEEHAEVEHMSVATIEQLVHQLEREPETAPAPPAHLTG